MDIRKYQRQDGKVPFDIWMLNLKDRQAKARILIRLKRIESGSFGDTKPLSAGIYELRFTEGQGYRVYYGRKGDEIVILLCGGKKATQSKDIKQARQYWSDYHAE